MSDEDLKKIRKASTASILIVSGYIKVPSLLAIQKKVNKAWDALGKKMGFDWKSVEPVPNKGPNWFSAIPRVNNEIE